MEKQNIMYLYQISIIATIQLETDLLLEISVLQTIFRWLGNLPLARRQLNVGERVGFSFNCYWKKIADQQAIFTILL